MKKIKLIKDCQISERGFNITINYDKKKVLTIYKWKKIINYIMKIKNKINNLVLKVL